MGKRKKEKLGKLRLDSTEILKEVNKCDQKFNIDLKRPNKLNEPEMLYELTLVESKNYLKRLVVALNGIDVDDFFSTHNIATTNIQETIEFTNISNLNWGSDRKYYITSMGFRYRFLTKLIIDILENLDTIAVNQFDLSGKKFGLYEFAYLNLRTITNDIRKLVLVVLSGKEYGNILLKVILHTSYLKTKNVKEYNQMVFDGVSGLKDGLSRNVLNKNEPWLDDDMAIYLTVKLAYILCTGKLNLSIIPKFKKFKGINRDYDLKEMLIGLGHSIMKEKKYAKRPIPYVAFNTADPLLLTRYHSNKNKDELSVGIRALSYVDFVCSDKNIHNLIERVVRQ